MLKLNFTPKDQVIERFARGGPIAVYEPEENEVDLIIPGVSAFPEIIYIMSKLGGQLTMPTSKQIVEALKFEPIAARNTDGQIRVCRFCASIDAKGTGTGISALARSITIRKVASWPKVSSENFAQPGHVFPLIGCLEDLKTRAGHTEAALALCELAGLQLVAAMVEIASLYSPLRMATLEEVSWRFKGVPITSTEEIAKWL